MIFNILWTIILSIIGGLLSSLIVSKVFLIQQKFQEQLDFVEKIIRKIGYIGAFIQSSKVVFEVSYDEEREMKQEMREKGYKTENEYYLAHKDKRWISKDNLLKSFKKEIDKTGELIVSEINNNPVKDENLKAFLKDVVGYVRTLSSINEFTFSNIETITKKEQSLLESSVDYLQMSRKTLLKIIIHDKMMFVLCLIFVLLIIGTIISGILGI